MTTEPKIEPSAASPSTSPPLSWLARFGRAAHEGVFRFVGRPRNWALFVGLFASLHIARAIIRPIPQPPVLRLPLPAFELTDERGARFGLANLRGKVWVADFVFTTCPTVCPKLTERMGQIQQRSRNLGQTFHMVTFTVDPENDTPERLMAYSKANHANPTRWTFLTGSLGDVETTVVKGFKITMGKEETSPNIFSIFHGERLVLVDKEGAIRGYYEANDEGMEDVLYHAGLLVNVPEPREPRVEVPAR